MNTHTPGQMERRHQWPVLYIGEIAIAKTDTSISPGQHVTVEQARANADRMILCWNTHDTLLAQRDELAAVLEDLLDVAWPNDDCADSRTNRAIEKARAVLAKVREEKGETK